MICFGKPISAAKAQSIGLIQDIDDDVIEAAFLVNTEDLLCRVPTWELPFPDWDQEIAEKITQKIDQRMVGQNAPKRALEIAKLGSELPFEAAMQQRAQRFSNPSNRTPSTCIATYVFRRARRKTTKRDRKPTC